MGLKFEWDFMGSSIKVAFLKMGSPNVILKKPSVNSSKSSIRRPRKNKVQPKNRLSFAFDELFLLKIDRFLDIFDVFVEKMTQSGAGTIWTDQ